MTKARDEKLIKAFGKRIRELRTERRITQEQFASELGIETRQLGRIERGEVNPTLSTINALARALNKELSEVFSDIKYK